MIMLKFSFSAQTDMTSTDNDRSDNFLSDGTAIRSGDIGFAPGDLVDCAKCGRSNAPDRPKCIYCGERLSTAAVAEAAGDLRRPDDIEPGFNVIAFSRSPVSTETACAVAEVTGMPDAAVAAVLNAMTPLPVARLASEADAAAAAARLNKLGIASKVVADRALAVDQPPMRLHSIEFGIDGCSFIDFNSGVSYPVEIGSLALIVIGTIIETKTERLEKRKRAGNAKLLDESETSADYLVIDIYSRLEPRGWRILPTGFDFSCLGGEKGLIAAENMRRLADRLRRSSSNIRFADRFDAVPDEISLVWEPERRRDSRGLVRSGMMKFDFGAASSSSNLGQFNRYSRMQWHLL